jgi:hypothetical protein
MGTRPQRLTRTRRHLNTLQGLLVTTPGALSLFIRSTQVATTSVLRTCAQCTAEFLPSTRGGKVQTYCARTCQITAANMRRASTHAARTNPPAVEPSTQPLSPALIATAPTLDRLVSDRQDTPSERLSELMALAHSRGGIGPWEVAELAKLRGISPWAPLRVILAKEASK